MCALLLFSLALARPIALATPVNFDIAAQNLAEALLVFSKQAKVEILFPFDELRDVPSPAVSGLHEPHDALSRLLHGTGFSTRRNRQGKFVVTSDRRVSGSVRGQLVDAAGAPLRGVSVALPRSRKRTATDDNGEFEFQSVPPGTYELIAAAPGYQPLELQGIRVDANRMRLVESHTLLKSDDVTRLEPYVVRGESVPLRAVDRSLASLGPQTAISNLDLPRTRDDALPYTIYDRDQITRSGVVNLNEFFQREVLDSDATTPFPEQNGSLFTGSTNLRLRGYEVDETIVLVNGRRLPEILTAGSGRRNSPDVNFIPLSLVQQIQVLPISASALYSGNAVGGVINIVLRPDVDVTEVTATYTNALDFDAPQSSVSLQHGQSLLDRKLRLRLNASFTRSTPPNESELGFRQARALAPFADSEAVYRATPNVRSANGMPLLGPGSSPVTSVAPGAAGNGGLAAFAGREGVRNLNLFDAPGELAVSLNSLDYAYGRRQRRSTWFGSAVYDVRPWLQLGLDGSYARTVINRGFDVFAADLDVGAGSPFNPFPQAIRVSLNETAPLLGEDHSEARLDSASMVGGILLKLPADWRVTLDAQYGRNVVAFRGLGGADTFRWQELVDQGVYDPLRDTQAHGPPQEFYDRVLVHYGAPGRFVKLGDYDALDAAARISNSALPIPTGLGVLNLGADYRRNRLSDYDEELRFADGTAAFEPVHWAGRTLQRYSIFGEIQGPVVPAARLPRAIKAAEADIAVRYVAADTSNESNVAPTFALKIDFTGGFSIRGSVTTSNRFPTPEMSQPVFTPGAGGPGVDLTTIADPLRNQGYDVQTQNVMNPDLSPEGAVTQTAGMIFQGGNVHRFRVSLDFVDTTKSNELIPLEAQAAVNLEALFPERVLRAPSAPDDPGTPGRITTIFTGIINATSRHSQSWNASLDYAWTELAGGTLEAYARVLHFRKYDRQLAPGTPVVDQLAAPDGTAIGLLKYRANFGAGWSSRLLGFGVDGHYFHSRVLPVPEWLSQGDTRIKPYWQFDAHLQCELSRWLPWKKSGYGLRGQLRVNNLSGFGFPKYANDSPGAGVQPYGDWRGRTYSVSVTATF